MRSGSFGILVTFLFLILVFPVSAQVTFVTSGPQTIVKGDTVTLTGNGAENGTVALWIIGQNYFSTKMAVPDKKGNFMFTVPPTETTLFSPGTYAFIIQDPSADKTLEIGPLFWTDGIRIANKGKVIANIGPISSFPADITPIANVIVNASESPGVDDIFTPYYYYVEDPWIHFNRINDAGYLPDQTTGEAVLIAGTTNVGPENHLHIDIKNATSGESVTSQDIQVQPDPNTNQWSYSLDEPGLPPGSYVVTVSEQKYTTTESVSAKLNVLEYLIAGNPQGPGGPQVPVPNVTSSAILLPLLISCGALVIIGIIMLVSLRK